MFLHHPIFKKSDFDLNSINRPALVLDVRGKNLNLRKCPPQVIMMVIPVSDSPTRYHCHCCCCWQQLLHEVSVFHSAIVCLLAWKMHVDPFWFWCFQLSGMSAGVDSDSSIRLAWANLAKSGCLQQNNASPALHPLWVYLPNQYLEEASTRWNR